MKITLLDRILLLLMVLLAAYQVVVGIDQFTPLPIIAYTIAFGVLIIAGLLLVILGFEVLDSPAVVIASTVIPLALSLGLVWQHIPSLQAAYLFFAILGFLAVVVTRLVLMQNKLPILVIALVHGIAGLTIFLLPLVLSFRATLGPAFSLV